MLRLAPRLFRPLFAAFFGCISLLGQGLHVLVEHPLHEGQAVSCACSAGLSRCADRGHTHRGCGQGNAQTASSTPAPVSGASENTSSALAADTKHDPHQCPICGFFAQAQWAVYDQPELCAGAVAPLAQQVARLWPVTAVGVYQSRAPPFGAALS
jgi:hypothetical protein